MEVNPRDFCKLIAQFCVFHVNTTYKSKTQNYKVILFGVESEKMDRGSCDVCADLWTRLCNQEGGFLV